MLEGFIAGAGLVLIIAIVSSAFALYYARSVLVPFVLALFLRFLIAPLIDFQIYKLKIHRYVAIPIAILVVVYFFVSNTLLF